MKHLKILKANNREIFKGMDFFGDRPHKNKKKYDRKTKHKNGGRET